jgi:hypothetical protein
MAVVMLELERGVNLGRKPCFVGISASRLAGRRYIDFNLSRSVQKCLIFTLSPWRTLLK